MTSVVSEFRSRRLQLVSLRHAAVYQTVSFGLRLSGRRELQLSAEHELCVLCLIEDDGEGNLQTAEHSVSRGQRLCSCYLCL